MSRRIKTISNLHQFLVKSGALEQGVEAVEQAKKQYWNEQKAKWRKAQRENTKTISVPFSLKEYAQITKQAQKHHKSRTRYAHDVTIAYGEQKMLQLEPMLANYIREALTLTYHAMRDLRDDRKVSDEVEKVALEKIEQVRQLIIAELESPKRIEFAFVELVREQPELKQDFIDLLNTL